MVEKERGIVEKKIRVEIMLEKAKEWKREREEEKKKKKDRRRRRKVLGWK